MFNAAVALTEISEGYSESGGRIAIDAERPTHYSNRYYEEQPAWSGQLTKQGMHTDITCALCGLKARKLGQSTRARKSGFICQKQKTDQTESCEGWIQCDYCNSWQHLACAQYDLNLYLDPACPLHSKVFYDHHLSLGCDLCSKWSCPTCKQDKNNSPGIELPTVDDLEHTALSTFIEKYINEGKTESSHCRVGVRVTYSVRRKYSVGKTFLDRYSADHSCSLPYTSRMISAFLRDERGSSLHPRDESTDVCFFSFCAQEFGKTSIYLSYYTRFELMSGFIRSRLPAASYQQNFLEPRRF